MAEAKADAATEAALSNAALMSMLVARLDAMQTDLKTTLANITGATKTGAVSQDSMFGAISTKQDVGGDESQSAGLAVDSGNKRSYDNAVAYQAFRFADRDRTLFDNVQALIQISMSNMVFNNNRCQSWATVAAHKATLDAGKFEGGEA